MVDNQQAIIKSRDMPEEFYEKWERLFNRSKMLFRNAKVGKAKWSQWERAAKALTAHENSFRQ